MVSELKRPFSSTQNLNAIFGPSFLDGLPNHEDWVKFIDNIEDEKAVNFANLWFVKASEANGVPLRKDFSFEEFVKYGTNLLICKIDADNNWISTFCGSEIVENSGFDFSGKVLGEFSAPQTVDFWQKNLKILTQEHRPIIEFHKLEYSSDKYFNCTAISFPLISEEGTSPGMFVGYEFFNSEKF